MLLEWLGANYVCDFACSNFYNVIVKDVQVGNVTIGVQSTSYTHGHFIVDSGTTDSYLPRSLKAPFEAAFENVTGLKYQASGAGCKGYTDEELDALPNIQLVLEAEDGGDLVLQVTPDQYLIQEKAGRYCASIFLTEVSGGGTHFCLFLFMDRMCIDSRSKQLQC